MKKRKIQTVIYYCAKDNRKHFLLLKMNERRGLFWQNVTGGVEKDESYKDAAIREAIEETNLNASNISQLIESDIEFQFEDQWKNHVNEKVFFLHCKESWDIKIDPSEHSQYKWTTEEELNSESVHFESNFQALTKALELQC